MKHFLTFKCSYIIVYFSGWPSDLEQLIAANGMEHPDTQQAIDTYIENWAEMGILIRPDSVEKNPARRNFAKLVLNK